MIEFLEICKDMIRSENSLDHRFKNRVLRETVKCCSKKE